MSSAAADVRDLVAVYKNPPYPIFYDVVYHSYALVPMLASNLYYSAKFSSTVLTSFITGECKTLAQHHAVMCSGGRSGSCLWVDSSHVWLAQAYPSSVQHPAQGHVPCNMHTVLPKCNSPLPCLHSIVPLL
jgi:hypothetical protein